MKWSMSAFAQLPPALKIAVGVLGGGSLMGLIYLVFPGHFWVILIGLLIVAAALAGYGYFLRVQRLRKAAPMQQGIISNSTATPSGISAAASVARLDDLNRKFQEGLEKFRSAGKNIYSLPWYALVGEPGSGKTEAIRHCNVGFPPGLQDQLQGAGGTLNMNWWFTNHAVILDTAGRLLFEEVQPGATNEWDEFLKLLRANRPNCPINGMLLTISAESLIKDTADDLERKGGKIAQQLDNIQRVLGVRFPVFIMITKCDLINGFREFFDGLNDPRLQHQILGWSNPAQLDEPFNPAEVDKHLDVVRQRLLRRRMTLLQDPVNTEDPQARRTDQVDSLFAFPEALIHLAPRLRRYLEMIFVAGEWSAKPLFLRGIYFTSAMREGSALDADLAEVLGVPVDSLPEGKVWVQDRAYFLRDLFLKKVFNEKGLVTRASNTRQLQRRRKGAVYGGGLGSLVFLLLVTGFGATQLKKSVGGQQGFWGDVKNRFISPTGSAMRIVDQPFADAAYEYNGQTELKLSDISTTLGQLPFVAKRQTENKVSTPWIFQPLRWFRSIATEGFDTSRRKALRVMFESGYLEPVIDAARSNMLAATADDWSGDATRALAQMIRIEIAAGVENPQVVPADDLDHFFSLDSLARYALSTGKSQKEYNKYKADDESLQTVLRWIYAKQGGGQPWPPRSLSNDPLPTRQAVDHGVGLFVEYWSKQIDSDEGNLLAQLVTLTEAMKSFKRGEDQLFRISNDLQAQIDPSEMSILAGEWSKGVELIDEAKETIDKTLYALGGQINGSITDLCQKARDEVLLQGAMPAYQSLLEVIGDEDRDNLDDDTLTHLVKIRSKLKGDQKTFQSNAESQAAQLEKQLPELFEQLLDKVSRSEARLYEVRYTMHQNAADSFRKGVAAIGELAKGYRAFPLCRTTDLGSTLSPQKFQAAVALVGQVAGEGPQGIAALGLGKGGGLDFHKQLKEDFTLLSNTSRLLAVGAHQDWYKKIQQVCDAFKGDPSLVCKLEVLPFEAQRDRPHVPGVNLNDVPLAALRFRYFEVHSGDRRIGQRMKTDAPWDGDLPEIVIPGKKLSIHFFEHDQSPRPGAIADMNGPWTVIKAMHTLDAASDDERRVWRVALLVKDISGTQYYYWVGLNFSRPILAIEDWPTEDNWPGQ